MTFRFTRRKGSKYGNRKTKCVKAHSHLSALDRLKAKCSTFGTEGCWEWEGGNNGSYGSFYYNGRLGKAHRAACWNWLDQSQQAST